MTGWLTAISLVFCFFIPPADAKVDRQNRPLTLIPDALIEPGPGDDKYIIVVEKATQQLYLLEFRKGQYYLLYSLPCTTGENIGDKEVEGDKKTPEGFYLINKKSLENELAPIYGVLAYPMDYPNFWDRHLGKSGSGIWLHGTNRPRVPLDTNGCIALENVDLIRLEELLRVYKTPIVVYDEITYKTLEEINEEAANIKEFVQKWLLAWRYKDFKTYKSCYAKDFTSDDNKDYRAWMNHKKRLNSFYSKIDIEIGNLRIFRHQGMISVVFMQDYRGDGQFVSQGIKRLYLREKKGDYKIVAEVWNPLPPPPDQRYLSAEVRQRVIEDARRDRLMMASLPKKIEKSSSSQLNGKAKATPTKPVPVPAETAAAKTIIRKVEVEPDIKKVEVEPAEMEEEEVVSAVTEEEPPEQPSREEPPAPEPDPAPRAEPREEELPEPGPVEPPVDAPQDKVAIDRNEKAPPVRVASVERDAALEMPQSSKSEEKIVRETITGWLKAWRDKDLDRYINYYHRKFRYNGMNLAEYRDYKNEINQKYKKISIGIDKMNIQVDGSQALVTFVQHYRSDQYKDYGLKTLILHKDAKGWHIRKESWKDMSGGARP